MSQEEDLILLKRFVECEYWKFYKSELDVYKKMKELELRHLSRVGDSSKTSFCSGEIEGIDFCLNLPYFLINKKSKSRINHIFEDVKDKAINLYNSLHSKLYSNLIKGLDN